VRQTLCDEKEVPLFNQPPMEIQATSPAYPDAIIGTFAYALWTPERLISIAARHVAPFSKGYVAGVQHDILLMLVTEHEWPLVCVPQRIGYFGAIQLGEHYRAAYKWLRMDIPRISIRLRKPA
jgi:hypothetical protein